MEMTLLRIEETYEGTIGVLLMDGIAFCVTLELRYLDNKNFLSCIPEGTYVCQRVDSPRYGDVFEVKHVPGREDILFHSGNTDDHTRGCILLGQYFGKLRGNRAVLNSGKTFNHFMEKLRGKTHFSLEVKKVIA